MHNKTVTALFRLIYENRHRAEYSGYGRNNSKPPEISGASRQNQKMLNVHLEPKYNGYLLSKLGSSHEYPFIKNIQKPIRSVPQRGDLK